MVVVGEGQAALTSSLPGWMLLLLSEDRQPTELVLRTTHLSARSHNSLASLRLR